MTHDPRLESSRRIVCLTALLVLLSGCAHDDAASSREAATQAVTWRKETAAATLDALEERLLSAPELALDYEISSEGALASSLKGALRWSGRDRGMLEGRGSFGPQDVVLELTAGEGRLEGRALKTPRGESTPVDDGGFQEATPEALREAIVIGLVRMGLLHNLAMLTASQPPDRAGGGVRDWVKLTDVRFLEPAEDRVVIAFAILVSGQASGEGKLFIDPASGLPRRREQAVPFPGGVMRVVETYTRLDA